MNLLKKFPLLSLVVLLCFAPGLQDAVAQVLNIEGEMESTVTAYITKRFNSSAGVKNLRYRLYLPTSQTEGINTQMVSRLTKTFMPGPTEAQEFTDKFGNGGLELVWNKEIRVLQIDVQFTVTTYSNYYSIDSEAPYPVVADEGQRIFLISTELAPSHDFIINYIGRTLSYGLTREIDVVRNIFLWIDKTIRLSNHPEAKNRYDALSVLKMRGGDERGICNLAVAMFKGLGIPARVVYGNSFQKEIAIKTDQQLIFYDYPNDERYWLEVFFPDLGWVSYGPEGTHFGSTSHVIRVSTGPDSDYASDTWSIEKGEVLTFSEFIYDIKSDAVNVIVKGSGEDNAGKIILSPVVANFTRYQREPDLTIGGLSAVEKAEELTPGATGTLTHNSDISQRLDIVATRDRVYAQKFRVVFPSKITEVRLPLIKFADEGRIWLEIYSDEGGKPGKVLFKTYSILSPRIRFMMVENPWLSFPVGEKTDSYLPEGEYWIALRSSGSCIFNWNAAAGNVIGDGKDTMFMDVSVKNPRWNNVLNYDLNFQVVGKREK